MKRHHAKRAEKKRQIAPAVPHGSNLPPPPERPDTAASGARDSTQVVLSSESPGDLLPLVLIIGIGVGLLVVAVALASRPALAAFSGRRGRSCS